MSTTVSVTENLTTVTDNSTNIAVTVIPTLTQVTISTGPVIIGGSSYSMQYGSGNPVNVVTPDFAGQLYQDNDTGQIYVSTLATAASWIELVRNY